VTGRASRRRDGEVVGQCVLSLDGPGILDVGPARTYWEHRGPGVWEPVICRVRYGKAPRRDEQGPVLPFVQLKAQAPRNVLIERADGTKDIVRVRQLRTRRPG
jgi:hypothetical protein